MDVATHTAADAYEGQPLGASAPAQTTTEFYGWVGEGMDSVETHLLACLVESPSLSSINVRSIAVAMSLLVRMRNAVAESGQSWVDPHITATDQGEVVMEWWGTTSKLTVYVEGDEVEVIRTSRGGGHLDRDEESVATMECQASLWARVSPVQ